MVLSCRLANALNIDSSGDLSLLLIFAMSLRAYYRNPTGDLNSPQDSGHPVPEEKLRTLGYKWWEVDGSPDQCVKTFKELSKNLGFEVGDYEHLYDLSKQTGMPADPAMVSVYFTPTVKRSRRCSSTSGFLLSDNKRRIGIHSEGVRRVLFICLLNGYHLPPRPFLYSMLVLCPAFALCTTGNFYADMKGKYCLLSHVS